MTPENERQIIEKKINRTAWIYIALSLLVALGSVINGFEFSLFKNSDFGFMNFHFSKTPEMLSILRFAAVISTFKALIAFFVLISAYNFMKRKESGRRHLRISLFTAIVYLALIPFIELLFLPLPNLFSAFNLNPNLIRIITFLASVFWSAIVITVMSLTIKFISRPSTREFFSE